MKRINCFLISILIWFFSCQLFYNPQAQAEDPPPLPCQQSFEAGWSMMSLPYRPSTEPDEQVSWKEIYPEGVVVYYYFRGGYHRISENQPIGFGAGYWIYHYASVTYTIIGEEIPSACVPIQCDQPNHWYMIGCTSEPSQIVTDDTDDYVIYKYEQDSGYIRVLEDELLEPGKGYWFKANGLICDIENEIFPFVEIRSINLP